MEPKGVRQMDEEIVKDPVCKMEKPISQMVASSVYEGETYYFCTQMDKEMFDKFPDKWIVKEEEE